MNKLRKGLGTLITLAALGSIVLLGLPSGADADSITLGASSQNITFTGNGAGSVTVTIGGLTGNAFFNSDPLGTYSFGATTFTAGPVSSNLYPAGANSETFTFTGGDGDTLSGIVVWSFIQDNTTQPKFFGTLTITSSAGDAAFLSSFSVGSKAPIDFFTNALSSGGTLDQLSATTNRATATISAGEVVPTPEPSSLVLFGIGLVVLCAYMRRKLETLDNLETGNLAA